MSRSPERISSYRRHFEDSSSSCFQVRVSSPSPTRRESRHASSSYSGRAGAGSMRVESVGRRTASVARRSRLVGAGLGAGAMVCVGPSGEKPIDLDVAKAENQEFLSTRTSERQEMIVLNDRLAVYIDKVRSLEQQNKLLETEIEAYQNRFERPSGLRLLYEEQLKELRKIAEQMRIQRDVSYAAKESTAAQLEAIKSKYEEVVELRKKAELDIEAFRPDVDKATSSRIILEKKLEQLEVEVEFMKRIHQQEIEELTRQIYAAHVSVQSAFELPDLSAALKQIQAQYDDIAAKNLQEMDSWYKNKFEDLTQKTTKHVDRARSIREEIAGAKKDIQNKDRDLDTLRTRNEALEAQIREMQEKHKKELEDLQARIEALKVELKSTKEKIALHLREYQELLNIKMALEIEITTYRKLIEGEDLRLSGMMQTLSLTSCSMSAVGTAVSVSGRSVDGVGGTGGGLLGARGVGGTSVGKTSREGVASDFTGKPERGVTDGRTFGAESEGVRTSADGVGSRGAGLRSGGTGAGVAVVRESNDVAATREDFISGPEGLGARAMGLGAGGTGLGAGGSLSHGLGPASSGAAVGGPGVRGLGPETAGFGSVAAPGLDVAGAPTMGLAGAPGYGETGAPGSGVAGTHGLAAGAAGMGVAGTPGMGVAAIPGLGVVGGPGYGEASAGGLAPGTPGLSVAGTPGFGTAGTPGLGVVGGPGSAAITPGMGVAGASGIGMPSAPGAGGVATSGVGVLGTPGLAAGTPGYGEGSSPGIGGAGTPGWGAASVPGISMVGAPGVDGVATPGMGVVGFPGLAPGTPGISVVGTPGTGMPGAPGVSGVVTPGMGVAGTLGLASGTPGDGVTGAPGIGTVGALGVDGVVTPGLGVAGVPGTGIAGAPGVFGVATPGMGAAGTAGFAAGTPGHSVAGAPGIDVTGIPGLGVAGAPAIGIAGAPGVVGVATSGMGGAGTQGFAAGTPGYSEAGAPGIDGAVTPGIGVVGAPGVGGAVTSGMGVAGTPGFAAGAPGYGETGAPGVSVAGTPGFGVTGTPGYGESCTPGVGVTGIPGLGMTGTTSLVAGAAGLAPGSGALVAGTPGLAAGTTGLSTGVGLVSAAGQLEQSVFSQGDVRSSSYTVSGVGADGYAVDVTGRLPGMTGAGPDQGKGLGVMASGVGGRINGDAAGFAGIKGVSQGIDRGEGKGISGPRMISSESAGMGKTGGVKGDLGRTRIVFGPDGCDGNIEAYAEQAVELTERRTVLIRTVKKEDDVVEMDHQEQTYTITGAANESDAE